MPWSWSWRKPLNLDDVKVKGAYGHDFYQPRNIIGWTGDINGTGQHRPSVYFAGPALIGGTPVLQTVGGNQQALYYRGRITQWHPRPDNIGRNKIEGSTDYFIVNTTLYSPTGTSNEGHTVTPIVHGAGALNVVAAQLAQGESFGWAFEDDQVPVTRAEVGHHSREEFHPFDRTSANFLQELKILRKAIINFPKIKDMYAQLLA